MKSYKHFSISEREILSKLHKKGLSTRKIAELLNRHHSSIARELKRNSKNKEYNPQKAQDIYNWRRKTLCRKVPMCKNLNIKNLLRKYIIEYYWSPMQISNRLKLENHKYQISYQTIYRYIYSDRLEIPKFYGQREVRKYLRRKGKKKRKYSENKGKINIVNHIEDRPNKANLREELGHWEADTVIGKQGKACLVTLVDRLSRKVLIKKISSKYAMHVKNALIQMLKKEVCKSITPDRGSEFAKHNEVTMELNIPFYFPKPGQPWQRGSNENTNGLIRQYIPKGKDITNISDEEIFRIQELINNRPRKCLNNLTSNEVHHSYFSKLLNYI